MLRHVRQAVLRAGVEPPLQSPVHRSSYRQLRASANYRTLPYELHLYGFSEATVRNDAGSLDRRLQIAQQLPAFSVKRSRSPSPLRVSLPQEASRTFFSKLSGSQLAAAARTQFSQQTIGNTIAPSDSALLAMRTPSPTSAASTGPQGEAITVKTALELLDTTLCESERQLSRDECAETERLGSAFSTEHWLQDMCGPAFSSAFHATH